MRVRSSHAVQFARDAAACKERRCEPRAVEFHTSGRSSRVRLAKRCAQEPPVGATAVGPFALHRCLHACPRTSVQSWSPRRAGLLACRAYQMPRRPRLGPRRVRRAHAWQAREALIGRRHAFVAGMRRTCVARSGTCVAQCDICSAQCGICSAQCGTCSAQCGTCSTACIARIATSRVRRCRTLVVRRTGIGCTHGCLVETPWPCLPSPTFACTTPEATTFYFCFQGWDIFDGAASRCRATPHVRPHERAFAPGARGAAQRAQQQMRHSNEH